MQGIHGAYLRARLEQLGLHAAVVFYPEKLSVEQLYGTVRYLEGLQEFLFYVPGGTVISSEELKQEIPLTEGEEEKQGDIRPDTER